MTNVDLSKTLTTATVDVKSAWLSKVNWTQVVGIAASLLVIVSGGKFNLPLDQQAEIVVAIQALQGVVTWGLRTFAKPSITPSQVK